VDPEGALRGVEELDDEGHQTRYTSSEIAEKSQDWGLVGAHQINQSTDASPDPVGPDDQENTESYNMRHCRDRSGGADRTNEDEVPGGASWECTD
jgi:hypothetical protein